MRLALSRFVLAGGALTFACATATEDEPGSLGGDGDGGTGATAGMIGSSGNSMSMAGKNTSGSTSTMAMGGKGGTTSGAFGGTVGTGGSAEGGKAGSGTGGSATAGSSTGGKGGTGSGGKGGAGGTTGTAGSSSGSGGGGSGNTAGATSTTCAGVADWTNKTYAIGDVVASTCSGPFAGGCASGQTHKFECNPGAGVPALPWCQQREPGVGNGWQEAWLDKGQCN